MNVQRSVSTLIPRENYAALVISGLGTTRKPSRASRTMQSFQLGHQFCQMCNFGEHKERSEGFSTTSTPHKSAGDSAQPQEPPPSFPPSPPPQPGSLSAGREGHRLETPRGRRWPGPASGPPGLSQPSGAEPSQAPRGGAGSAIFLGARARAAPLQPRRPAPTVGAPSLLELLDLLQAQPRALVDAEVAQHLLHGLCVSVLHGCGGPGRPRLASPRPPRLPPRTRAAGSCHRGRPGADSCPLLFLLLRGGGRFRLTGALNHPSPLPQKPPHEARPRRARPRGSEPPNPAASVRRFSCCQPAAGSAGPGRCAEETGRS